MVICHVVIVRVLIVFLDLMVSLESFIKLSLIDYCVKKGRAVADLLKLLNRTAKI